MRPEESAVSQTVLGSVGQPLVSAKPSALIPGRDVKANEQGAPKRTFNSSRGMFPQSRISTDMVFLESEGLLCMVECESVFLWLEGIEFGLSRTPKFRGEELKRKDEPLQGREPSSLRREDPLQRSNRLCRAAGKANARVRKGSHCTRIVPKEEGEGGGIPPRGRNSAEAADSNATHSFRGHCRSDKNASK